MVTEDTDIREGIANIYYVLFLQISAFSKNDSICFGVPLYNIFGEKETDFIHL